MMITPTPIHLLSTKSNNEIYIKRDDLLPFSFGGNKARKAVNFFSEILLKGYNVVVTYGSSSSNHCRVIANMAYKYNIPCYIITPQEDEKITLNIEFTKLFKAQVLKSPIDKVSTTIDNFMTELSKTHKPYFIQGGGHGNLGTQAYVDAYREIKDYEKKNNIYFDYIFHASGTGTTQAGLICGATLQGDLNRKIVGISIARKKEKGFAIIKKSVQDYLSSVGNNNKIAEIIFEDDYIYGGYGKYNENILSEIKNVLVYNGVPLNTTYTGKAFWGMMEYLKKNNIKNKKVLFINTGGSPLFFDDLKELK